MILFAIIISIAALYILIGLISCRIAFRRKKRKDRGIQLHVASPASFRADRDWLESQTSSDLYIRSFDGLRLHARLILHPNTSRIAVCCHAYRAHGASMAMYAQMLYSLGFSVLLPDARAHGSSEGQYIGMGYVERKDIVQWIDLLRSEYPYSGVMLFGVSMGAATVMNTLGESLPDTVKCAIEDCGYVSIREILTAQFRKRHCPPVFLYCAEPLCRILCGFSIFDRTSTLKALERCKIPLLLIHGNADALVPCNQMETAAAHCAAKTETLLIENADHADSISADPELYKSAVKRFADMFFGGT